MSVNKDFRRHKGNTEGIGRKFDSLPCNLTNVNSLFRQNVINPQSVTKQES